MKNLPDLKEWVKTWKKAGSALDEIRKKEIKEISTQEALMNLAQAFESARLNYSPRPTSGLVVQQALFQKLKK